MSGVMCQVSHVRCQVSLFIHFFIYLLNKVVELVVGRSVICVAYPVYFLYYLVSCIFLCMIGDTIDLINMQQTKDNISYCSERNDIRQPNPSFPLHISPPNMISVMTDMKKYDHFSLQRTHNNKTHYHMNLAQENLIIISMIFFFFGCCRILMILKRFIKNLINKFF